MTPQTTFIARRILLSPLCDAAYFFRIETDAAAKSIGAYVGLHRAHVNVAVFIVTDVL